MLNLTWTCSFGSVPRSRELFLTQVNEALPPSLPLGSFYETILTEIEYSTAVSGASHCPWGGYTDRNVFKVHSPKFIPIGIGIPSWIPILGWNSKFNTDSNWNSKLNSWSVGRDNLQLSHQCEIHNKPTINWAVNLERAIKHDMFGRSSTTKFTILLRSDYPDYPDRDGLWPRSNHTGCNNPYLIQQFPGGSPLWPHWVHFLASLLIFNWIFFIDKNYLSSIQWYLMATRWN